MSTGIALTNRDETPTVIPQFVEPTDEGRTVGVFRCHQPFDDLRATPHPDVKFCDRCAQSVFRVRDLAGVERAIASRGCVWGLGSLSTGRSDRTEFVGNPAIGYATSSGVEWED